MTISIVLGAEKNIDLGAIEHGSPEALPILGALGLAYLNFGRLEQALEFLLRYTNDSRLVTGEITRFPDVSFQLKVKLFKKIYVKHPRFKDFHEASKNIIIGLRKANESRVRLVHSNFQGFELTPTLAMKAVIVKWEGADLKTFEGTWTFQALKDFNTLICHLNNDIAALAVKVINPDFLKSLEKPMTLRERAIFAVRLRLSRLPRVRIERPFRL